MELVPVDAFKLLLSLAFGLVIGSFLNVVIVRLPFQKSVVKPGSHCVHCQSKIRWSDNIPVLSYLLLRGKCRNCGSKISIRYPVIELLTALLFVADGICFGWSPWRLFLRDWPFLAILVAITFIDLEHRIIPDELSLGGLVLGLVTFWTTLNFSFWDALTGAGLGFGLFYTLSWTYHKMRGRMGLGGGDIKLLAMIGAFLGPTGVLVTICVSSIFGSLVGLIWARLTLRGASSAGGNENGDLMQFAIPFGPFLVVGALVYYFLGDFIWYLYTNQI